MEPMTLGSPVGSPAQAGAMSGNTSQYLPSFLMGEQQAPNTARSNTLSPNKAGRNVSFGYAASPGGVASPADYNRSQLGQKTLFGGFQESATPTTPQHGGGAGGRNYMGTPTSHTAGVSGPPTQGLFDALRNERNQVQTPTRSQPPLGQSPYLVGTPIQQTAPPMQAAPPPYYSMQQTYQHTPLQQQFNDSYFSNANNASFNTSTARGGGIVSPLASTTPQHLLNNSNVMYAQQQQQSSNYPEFWVTVFGFPPNATGTVLQHFAQCGTILDKVFPAQTGNWVHLKYASRMECDKALNYNEKILANNIMIGVTQCKDTDVVDKENIGLSNEQYNNSQSANTPVSTQAIKAKVRPLVQSAGNENSVVASPSAPQKVSGLVNKAMDLFFGW